MAKKKEERWKIFLCPKYLNFHLAYKRLLDLGANDKMIHDSLVKILEQEFFTKIGPRSEDLFRDYWLSGEEVTLKKLGQKYGLSRERCRQINKHTEERLVAKTGFPRIIRIRVKQSLYQDVLEKIMQQK